MARSLKPQKITDVRHRTIKTMTVDIMLDRNKLDFFFTVGATQTRAESADEAIRLARLQLDKFTGVVWESVICIIHKSDDGNGYNYNGRKNQKPNPRSAGMDLTYKRFERGSLNGKYELKRKHLLDCDAYDLKQRENNATGDHYWERDGAVIPYTEEAWAALAQMVQAIHGINARLDAMLSDHAKIPELLARLATRMVPQLPEHTRGAKR
jgi:hypothetical protein